MTEKLSKYKFRRIATESFKNGLRLHFDSIKLFKTDSYPSSLMLAIIALEEFSKSNWVEHYYWSSITGSFPDVEFEQEWLKLLYKHPKKQKAFLGWGDAFEYSPRFIKSIENNELEILKQKATYVGLNRIKGKVDVKSRISIPQKTNQSEPKKIISLNNNYLLEICERKKIQEIYFDIEEKDDLITDELYEKLKKWKYKSGLRSNKFY